MILVGPRTRRGVGPSALSSVGNVFSPGWSHSETICTHAPVASRPQETILLQQNLHFCWLSPGSEVRSPGDAGPLTGYIRHEIRLQVSAVHSTARTRDAEAPRKLKKKKKPQNAATSCNPAASCRRNSPHLARAPSKVSPPNAGFSSRSLGRGVRSR